MYRWGYAFLLLTKLCDGCSLLPGWLGIFVKQLRPTTIDEDTLWASFDVHNAIGGPFLPFSQRYALINMETGLIQDISCQPPFESFVSQPPKSSTPTAGYELSVDWPTVNITAPNNATTPFLLQTPHGESIDSIDSGDEHVFHFYSTKLDLLFLFYAEAQFKIVVAVVDPDLPADIMIQSVTYAEGLNYLLDRGLPELFDEVQLVVFPGSGDDCRNRFFLSFDEEGVSVSHVEYAGERFKFLPTLSYHPVERPVATGLEILQSQSWDEDYCFGEGNSGAVCGAQIAQNLTVTEFPLGIESNATRMIRLSQEQLVASLVNDPRSCSGMCSDISDPCDFDSDCCSNRCAFSQCRRESSVPKASLGDDRGGAGASTRIRGAS